MKHSIVSPDTLKQYAEKNSWRNNMDRSNGLDGWSNYGGKDLGHVVVVLGRNRDSEMLDESNFDCALSMLGGESETVKVHRFGHWACGWYELICVDPSDIKALNVAFNITQALADYPVLDEVDFSDREREAYCDYAEGVKEELADALALHFGLENLPNIRKALVDVAFALSVEAQYNAGSDACINVYTMHEPDGRDLERLSSCLDSTSYNYADDSLERALVDYLAACLGGD